MPGVIAGVMAVCALVGGVTGAQGVRATLLSWFHFFPGMCPLVRGWVKAGGVGAALLNWFHSFPSAHIHAHAGRGSLYSGQRQLAPFPPSVCMLIGSGGLHLSREQYQSRRCWSRSPVQAGGHAGVVLACQPEHLAGFICFLFFLLPGSSLHSLLFFILFYF